MKGKVYADHGAKEAFYAQVRARSVVGHVPFEERTMGDYTFKHAFIRPHTVDLAFGKHGMRSIENVGQLNLNDVTQQHRRQVVDAYMANPQYRQQVLGFTSQD